MTGDFAQTSSVYGTKLLNKNPSRIARYLGFWSKRR
jgi:hypothetical protein